MTKSELETVRSIIRNRNDRLPGEWSAGIGEGNQYFYNYWYRCPNWEIDIYHNEGGDHHVELFERADEDGEHEVFPVEHLVFYTEKGAQIGAEWLMEDYQ